MILRNVNRQYTYAYVAVCPQTGESYSLILPYVNTLCMSLFMDGLSEEFQTTKADWDLTGIAFRFCDHKIDG